MSDWGSHVCSSDLRAITDFNMIEDGDKVMVCLSGGKDSYGMLDILLTLKARAPINFDIIAVNLDQKQPDFPDHVLPDYLRSLNVPFHIETQDTYRSEEHTSELQSLMRNPYAGFCFK